MQKDCNAKQSNPECLIQGKWRSSINRSWTRNTMPTNTKSNHTGARYQCKNGLDCCEEYWEQVMAVALSVEYPTSTQYSFLATDCSIPGTRTSNTKICSCPRYLFVRWTLNGVLVPCIPVLPYIIMPNVVMSVLLVFTVQSSEHLVLQYRSTTYLYRYSRFETTFHTDETPVP